MKLFHRIVRWLLVVLPPGWIVALALAFYFSFEGLHQYTLTLDAKDVSQRLALASHGVVLSLVVGYSLFRGIAFHPGSRVEYLAWLALTPWRLPRPLPLGPVHIVVQDLVVLALFEVMLVEAPVDLRLLVPAIFLFVIVGCWAVWVWATGLRTAAYQVGYALGATLWIASQSLAIAAAFLAANYLLAYHSLRQSFAPTPWTFYTEARLRNRQRRQRPRNTQGLVGEFIAWGWAYDVFSPQRVVFLPLWDRLMLSGLAGWSAMAILSHSHSQNPGLAGILGMVSALGCGFYCCWHVLSYVWSHSPPISLLGRLVTFRWVIPSYDVALLPIVYFFGTVYTVLYLTHGEWPIRLVLPAGLTAYLLLMNVATPDINKWRLTCKSRLSPWAYAAAKTEYEQL